ncbi:MULTISPECIES: histidine utilization repressor [Comamonas]|nr:MULTISPECIES: histidine utilization repressor [Comamonas]KGG84604.1 GntR family transcriptional regulator [Comamonas thiooxydans]KGG95969.1 GntR family transcriptional regulator [Comamonas thiooxydans]KGH02353.1 GntR family transcriptional regulator [Comamonas thiooxydans]KGH09622.1 GntR family transcriptional regulator [Comamonas thiooxydans]KGH16073.1 GntR family transcriptional regulator [Comamonas thiooxydans]
MDKHSSMSLHGKILTEIEQNILSGRWPPGYRIPSEMELTVHYQCSRMTVSKVLNKLAEAGLLVRKRKAGSFVTRPQTSSAVLEIPDLRQVVLGMGQEYSSRLLGRTQRRSTREDMEAMRMARPASIVHVLCLHMAGSRPFCIEDRLINLESVPDAEHEPFTEHSPSSWMVNHVPWSSAEHRIRAEAASEETAGLLEIKPGFPCLVIDRRTWTGQLPITFVRLTYPADLYELDAHFSPSTIGQAG